MIKYYYALKNYCQTEKARRDLADYSKAMMLMGSVMVAARLAIEWLQS